MSSILNPTNAVNGAQKEAPWDHLTITYDSVTQESYRFYLGGSASAVLLYTIVIVYTDSTKANISTVTYS
jgi:hypothetical protein